ncbi:MAG: magnesium/cobalt transporter CorA [Terrimicrobiaceae bacterium]|jgi:magnesium transporter
MIRFNYKPPGTPPATLLAPEGASATAVLRLVQYDADSFSDEVFGSIDDLLARIDPAKVNWIDIDGLGDIGLLQKTAAHFGLHPLAIEDVLNTAQRPKVEFFGDHYFIVSSMACPDGGDGLLFEQVSLFLGRHFLVTVQEDGDRDVFEKIRARLGGGRGTARASGPDYLAYALLDASIDSIFPVLESVGDSIEDVEEELLEKPRRSSLRRLYESKRILLALRRAAWPHREIFNTLLRDDTGLVARGTQWFLRDCYDHTTQIIDIIESYRDLSAGLMDLYLSSVGFRTNEIIRVLTVVSVLFIPLTFLAGVYGMNFNTDSPWNMPELNWPFGYALFWLACAAIVGTMMAFFIRKGWLGKS